MPAGLTGGIREASHKERPHAMNAFVVSAPNKPGELARITEAISHRGINVTGFSGATCGDQGSVCILTNDEAGTRSALDDAHCDYHTTELVAAQLADSPGSLNDACQRLARAGVNIEAAIATGMSGGNITVAFATDNPTRAREALGQGVLTGSASGRSPR